MKGTIIQPDGTETEISFDGEPTLKQLQDIVGGLIELVRVSNAENKRVHMVVHEEGLLIGLPYNTKATEHYHRGWVVRDCEARGVPYRMYEHSPIVGPALLLEGELT